MTTKQTHHKWDCWGIYDPQSHHYHAFRLYAEQHHKEAEQHDKHSRLLYATTHDLKTFTEVGWDIIEPSSDSSIWTGCTIRRPDGHYQLFYTERTTQPDYWAGQSIRSAIATDMSADWQRQEMQLTPESVDPDGSRFLRRPESGARTIHAWRDPFVFGFKSQIYMLISAKSAQLAATSPAACVALLKARDQSLSEWDLVHESIVPGVYEELEVPQLYEDAESEEAVLIASTWGEEDYVQSMKMGYNPFQNEQNTSVRSKGYLLEFRSPSMDDALQGKFGSPKIVLDPFSGIYAGVLVPEFGGAVIGFKVGNTNNSDDSPQLIANILPNLRHPEPKLKQVV